MNIPAKFITLLDIRRSEKSILDTDGFVMTSKTKTIAGILSSTENVTAGDLPRLIFISTEEEYFESFSFFIIDKMVDANGSLMVGYYEERAKNSILAIKVLPR